MKPIYLRTLREKLGLTQEQLEVKAGVSQKTISKYETHADVQAAFDTVIKLADALGVEPRSLRFGPDPRVELQRAAS